MLHRLHTVKLSEYVLNMICVLAFMLPFAWTITTPLIYLTIAMAIIDLVLNQKRFRRINFHGKLFLTWVVLAGLSLWQAPKLAECFYNYRVIFAQYVGLYFMAYFYIDDVRKFKRVLYALLASSIAVSAYGIYQYMQGVAVLTQESKWVDIAQFPQLKDRVFSTLDNPNLLATFLLMMICMVTGLLLDRPKDNKNKWFLYLVAAVNLLCLLFTFSRGAWLTLLLIMCILGVLINVRIIYILAVIIALSLLGMHEVIIGRIMSIFNQTDTSAALRWAYWDSTIQMIEWNPWGIGWSAYRFVYPEYDYFINNPSITIYHAHNMYLNMIAEIGIIGGAVYISLFIYAFIGLYRIYKFTAHNKGCILAIISGIVAVMLMGITDYPLFNIQLSCVFWLVIGSVFGAADSIYSKDEESGFL